MAKLAFLRTFATIAVLSVGMLAGCGLLPCNIFSDAAPATTTESTTPESTTPESTTPESTVVDAALLAPSGDCLALGQPSDATHRAIFEHLNQFRVANGLQPLVYSMRLEAAANAHVRDLYERGFFAHINPAGQNPGQRAIALGFCHEYVGENIAAGQKSAESVEIAWENSSSHRENMLEPNYKYAGVGFFQDPTGRMYWAQELAYQLP